MNPELLMKLGLGLEQWFPMIGRPHSAFRIGLDLWLIRSSGIALRLFFLGLVWRQSYGRRFLIRADMMLSPDRTGRGCNTLLPF